MNVIEQRLLNDFQRGFPLTARPYAVLAARLGVDENAVLAALARLIAGGEVSRVGPTFAAGAIGVATLAAMCVPRERLARIAALVSACPEVNHNYEREHHYNLWFVVTGPDARHIEAVVRGIERVARCGRVLSLPMVEPYHIDLGFDLDRNAAQTPRMGDASSTRLTASGSSEYYAPSVALSPAERALVIEVQEGLPLVTRPYAELAERAGMTEDQVLATLGRWLGGRVINRIGVIVRHHELGYRANAMVVWDVPDGEARAVGRRIAAAPYVTLCYRRMRELPAWRYNLYCMIHGRDRDRVRAQIGELRANCGLGSYPSEVLFSRQRFKQRGGRYLAFAARA